MDKKDKVKKKKMPRYKRVIRLWCWKLSKNWKLADRVGRVNVWASNHPKKFFGITVGILSFCTLTTFISLGAMYFQKSDAGQKPSSLSSTAEAVGDPIVMENINRFHELDNNRVMMKKETKALTDQGMLIKKELDSLVALPEKSYDDSVRIVQDYHNLKSIVDFLNRGKK